MSRASDADTAGHCALGAAAATGLATGIASTYPWELGPGTSLPAWAVIGVLIGLRLGRGRQPLAAGATYGALLSLAFLCSRFGGSAGSLPAYTVFVLSMALVGGLAGVVSVGAGSLLRRAVRAED